MNAISTSTPASVTDEYVTFVQHQLPGLDDGQYQLTVSQHVLDATGKPISDDSLTNSYTFAVQGDRFRFADPASTIASTFPADNATGEFTTVLPHVVFNSATLPWARYPTLNDPVPVLLPGEDVDADVPTWLAVLLLDDDDPVGHPQGPITMTVGDLFPPAAVSTTTLGSNYSYFDGATNTAGLEIGESITDPVQVIDVPMSLFVTIAPTIADLALTAHVRKVSVENKVLAAGATPPDDPIGTFSIVVGTRLAQTQKKARAYLVSLEELQRFLPSDAQGTTPTGPNVDVSRFIRLAVLASWTYFSTGESAMFVDQLLALNGGPAAPGTTLNTNVRLDRPGTTPPVSNVLAMGYVPLDHDLRDSGNTVTWYRGPLSPNDVVPPDVTLPVASPDQVMVYDPTTGMLDVSLSAAWTIGRLIALQDSTFATALYSWKQGLAQQVVNAVEQELIDEIFGPLLSLAPAPPRRAPTSRQLLHGTMRVIATKGDQP